MRNMQEADIAVVLSRIEQLERKLDLLLSSLTEEETGAKPDPLASLDHSQPLDLGSDWATL
jgi:hypothetical protein